MKANLSSANNSNQQAGRERGTTIRLSDIPIPIRMAVLVFLLFSVFCLFIYLLLNIFAVVIAGLVVFVASLIVLYDRKHGRIAKKNCFL